LLRLLSTTGKAVQGASMQMQCTPAGIVRECGEFEKLDGRWRPPLHDQSKADLDLFVLIGLIHGQAAKFVGDFQQPLVAFVPFG